MIIDWINFENELLDKPYFTIDNLSRKSVVLFGNCHISTIGFFLNHLLNYKFNIHIIISWYCYKVGLEKFNMQEINNEISNLLLNCDIFIFQKHIRNYGINAVNIEQRVNKFAKIMQIPNMRLDYTINDEVKYKRSLEILEYSILNSNFPDFIFVIKHNNIHFFNTPEHPTHYILYLLSKWIYLRIMNIYVTISISDYFNIYNRKDYKKITNFVRLPEKFDITPEISKITGILLDSEHFD
jgi:hypothetical protein